MMMHCLSSKKKNQNKFAFCTSENLKRKKKKIKRKEMNKGTCITKKNCMEKFEIQNFRRDTAALVLVEDTEVTNKEEVKT